MGTVPRKSLTLALLAVAASWAMPGVAAVPVQLFNGKDLTGWVNVYGTPDTWAVRDGALVCTVRSPGFLRTEKMYQNYVLDLEWRSPGRRPTPACSSTRTRYRKSAHPIRRRWKRKSTAGTTAAYSASAASQWCR